MTAKTFGVRPSDYLDDLGSYEKYCFDELIAFELAAEQAKRYDEAKEDDGETDDDVLAILNDEKYRKK